MLFFLIESWSIATWPGRSCCLTHITNMQKLHGLKEGFVHKVIVRRLVTVLLTGLCKDLIFKGRGWVWIWKTRRPLITGDIHWRRCRTFVFDHRCALMVSFDEAPCTTLSTSYVMIIPACTGKLGPALVNGSDQTCRDEHGSGLDRIGSGLKPIFGGSGLDWTAIFLKIGVSGLDRTQKTYVVLMWLFWKYQKF